MRRAWLFGIASLALAAACTDAARTPEQTREGSTAPAFSLASADGEQVSLDDHAGRSVLLYFSMGPG